MPSRKMRTAIYFFMGWMLRFGLFGPLPGSAPTHPSCLSTDKVPQGAPLRYDSRVARALRWNTMLSENIASSELGTPENIASCELGTPSSSGVLQYGTKANACSGPDGSCSVPSIAGGSVPSIAGGCEAALLLRFCCLAKTAALVLKLQVKHSTFINSYLRSGTLAQVPSGNLWTGPCLEKLLEALWSRDLGWGRLGTTAGTWPMPFVGFVGMGLRNLGCDIWAELFWLRHMDWHGHNLIITYGGIWHRRHIMTWAKEVRIWESTTYKQLKFLWAAGRRSSHFRVLWQLNINESHNDTQWLTMISLGELPCVGVTVKRLPSKAKSINIKVKRLPMGSRSCELMINWILLTVAWTTAWRYQISEHKSPSTLPSYSANVFAQFPMQLWMLDSIGLQQICTLAEGRAERAPKRSGLRVGREYHNSEEECTKGTCKIANNLLDMVISMRWSFWFRRVCKSIL